MPDSIAKLRGKNNIVFGTDGWRAVIGDTFTFDNVRSISQATVDYLLKSMKSKKKIPRVLVGYDTRFMSEKFAEIVACVFAANKVAVILSDRATPTPTVSFAVKQKKLDLGIMITASHNPPEFNGFKIKSATGGSANPSITKQVEKFLFKKQPKSITLQEGFQNKSIVKEDITRDYVQFLRSYLDLPKLKDRKFRVLLDCMHGSGNGFMKEVIADTAIDLEILRGERNPYFDGRGPEPIEKNLEKMISRMKQESFDLGLVLDGDADRIAAVAPGGEFISPQKILCLLALHLKEDRGMGGGIVKTIVGTQMIHHVAKYLKLPLHETPVGFKYISQLMETKDILVGGEEAGGMGFKNYVPERDGSLAGLLLLEMMAFRNKTFEKILTEVESMFGRYYYSRDALKFKPGSKLNIKAMHPEKILDTKVVGRNDSDGLKFICQDESWLMLRPSGTEPIIRIYAESKSRQKTDELLELGKKLVLQNLH